MILNAITESLTQMFTTTDNLFSVEYTWQYMILVYIIIYVLKRLYEYSYKLLKNELPDDNSLYNYIFAFPLGLTIFIGIIYYVMVLLKIMWSSA